jgi:hypothetical protein
MTKLLTNEEARENMLINAKNTVTIYEEQIAFYEFVAGTKEDEKTKAEWLVQRDQLKAKLASSQEFLAELTPFLASYN